MEIKTLKFDPDRIRVVREMKGMSMSRFAEALGKQRQHIFNWESGRSIPDTSSLLRIVNVFQIEVGFFFVDNNHQINN